VKGEGGKGQVQEGIKGHSAEKIGANSEVSKPLHVRTYELCAQAAELVSHIVITLVTM
jgi:hypothetical protein